MVERSFSWDSMIRGYHIYRSVWEAANGEELKCVREVGNRKDPYAVAVVKNSELTVGHIPRRISSLCSMFLQRGGTISCTVTTSEKRYSHDLPQGGLEIPCKLNFRGNDKEVSKIQKLSHGYLNKSTDSEQKSNLSGKKASAKDSIEDDESIADHGRHSSIHPVAKRRKVSNTSSEHESAALMANEDMEAIVMGCKLSDVPINHAQKLLKKQFPKLNGFASTLLITKDIQISKSFDNKIQIFHSRKDHWITVSSVACDHGEIKVYDSSFTSLDRATERLIHKEFQSPGVKTVINIVLFQKQKGVKDCGLFAIACATSIAFGIDPVKQKLKQDSLRSHFLKCIQEKKLSPFPIH